MLNVISKLSISAIITKVEDIVDFMSYGVLRTPALVINEKVAVSIRVPAAKELKAIIRNRM